MKKTSEALESEHTIADMVLSFVTMHLNNDRFGTATKGLCENYLKAAPRPGGPLPSKVQQLEVRVHGCTGKGRGLETLPLHHLGALFEQEVDRRSMETKDEGHALRHGEMDKRSPR